MSLSSLVSLEFHSSSWQLPRCPMVTSTLVPMDTLHSQTIGAQSRWLPALGGDQTVGALNYPALCSSVYPFPNTHTSTHSRSHTHIHILTHIYTYTHTYSRILRHTYTHLDTYTPIHTLTYTCSHSRPYTHTHTQSYLTLAFTRS